MSKLKEFEDAATLLGAKLTRFRSPKSTAGFSIAESEDNGGCSLPECRCSPGLWIMAAEGMKGITAHFGSDYERGGEGYFTREDYKNWCKLSEKAHELAGDATRLKA